MTTRTMKSTLGQRVIAIDTAEEIGEIKSFVVDRHVGAVDKLHIAGRKKKALFLDWADLESFGDDAIMVDSEEAPETAATDRDVDSAKGTIEIIGARILDTAGFERGTVDDVQFDGHSGAITAVIGDDGTMIPADNVSSLGSYALVVRPVHSGNA